MSITPHLQTQIEALQSRIEEVAPDASPEDLVMLAKAVEAIGGQATVFDVLGVAQAKQNDLTLSAQSHLQTLATTLLEAQQSIVQARDEGVSMLQNTAQGLAYTHALALMF